MQGKNKLSIDCYAWHVVAVLAHRFACLMMPMTAARGKAKTMSVARGWAAARGKAAARR